MSGKGENLGRLVDVIRRLLGPGGCPWDRKQTHESLRPYLVEETHEVLEAIDSGDPRELCSELGDLLMQVVFHAELERERGTFELDDSIDSIADKLIRRHPHVFGDEPSDDGLLDADRWEELKKKEHGERSLFDGVPRSLPALRRAQSIGERLARVGFDWDDAQGPRDKIDEELGELDHAIGSKDRESIEHELGDVLLSTVNLARHLEIDAEDALRGALRRFETRFGAVEENLAAEGKEARECSIDELEAQWQSAKRQLEGANSS